MGVAKTAGLPRPFDEKNTADEQFFSKKRQKKCGEEIMTDKNSAIDNN